MSLLNNLRVLKDVRIGGNLDVAGKTTSSVTSISTTNLNITDRFMYVNKDHTKLSNDTASSGGYVVNVDPLLTLNVWDDSSTLLSFDKDNKHIHVLGGKDNLVVDNSATNGELVGTAGSKTVGLTGAALIAVDANVNTTPDYYNNWTLELASGPGSTSEYRVVSYSSPSFTLATAIPETLNNDSKAVVSQFHEGDFIQVSDSRDHTNDGVYSVLDWAPAGGNGMGGLITVKDTGFHPLSDFVQTKLSDDHQLQSGVDDTGAAIPDSAAHVTHIRVSLFKHQSYGVIEHSHGDDENELAINASTLQTTPPNTCIIVGATRFANAIPLGHPALLAVNGETVLDLSSVLPQHLAEVYIMEADDATDGGAETTLKLILPSTGTLHENKKIRVIRKQATETSNLVLIETDGVGKFDDGATPLSNEYQLTLEGNADKVDLSSANCQGSFDIWYMG